MWQNPNDPDDENEHFKQPHIAIEEWKYLLSTFLNTSLSQSKE